MGYYCQAIDVRRVQKMPVAETVIILVMLLFNAVFAAYELALASVSVVRLSELVAQKRPGGALTSSVVPNRCPAWQNYWPRRRRCD